MAWPIRQGVLRLGDLPPRSQRDMPNSIATLRIRLARTLVHVLPRCPCCGRVRQWPVEQNE